MELNKKPSIVIPSSMQNDFAIIRLAKRAFDGHICEYDLAPHNPCSDVLQYFHLSADLVRDFLSSLSSNYLLQGRMIARCRFFRINDITKRVEEQFLSFPSLSMSVIHDGGKWFTTHSSRIIEQLDNLNPHLEFDSIQHVYVKLIIHNKTASQTSLHLGNCYHGEDCVYDIESKCDKFLSTGDYYCNEDSPEESEDEDEHVD